MVKPLRSEEPAQKDIQFAHFGVLNDGQQSKASLFTSISLNIIIAIVVVIIGAAAKKTMDKSHKLDSISLAPIKKIEPEPIKPKIVPKLPEPPKIKVEPPKIKLPDVVKLPDPPKIEVKMTQPAPILPPAPPKLVTAPPAPKVVSLAQAMPATVAPSAHPSPVALGQHDNPIALSKSPATMAVNLGNRGAAGMPASNTGTGATKVSLGSGSPSSSDMHATGPVAVAGIKGGVVGGTGPLNATGRVAGPVNLGQVAQVSMPKPVSAAATPVRTGPKVLFKPRPEYTEEATRLHIEGVVSVRIHVSASGSVQVVGVTSDLGHGLGQSAIRAIQGTRFQPAIDASGQPIDWEGVVNVAFQLAG